MFRISIFSQPLLFAGARDPVKIVPLERLSESVHGDETHGLNNAARQRLPDPAEFLPSVSGVRRLIFQIN
jgi:hypothetical protein